MKTENRKVALVLSGGGARGLAHIGVIEELLRAGYQITSIAGTSIGSLIGGIYVSGKLPEFKEWISSIGKLDIIRLLDFAIYKNRFVKGEKVFRKLQDFIDDVNIENLSIPYSAVAVDIKSHREIVFRSGSLVKAIRASVSIPTLIQPLNYEGIELVDGGVLNPLHLNIVKRTDHDIVVAVDLNSNIPYSPIVKSRNKKEHHATYLKAKEYINRKWQGSVKKRNSKGIGFFDLITESIYTMQMKLTEVTIEKYQPELVVRISRRSCEIYEYHRAEELIEYGRKQFISALNDFLRRTVNIP